MKNKNVLIVLTLFFTTLGLFVTPILCAVCIQENAVGLKAIALLSIFAVWGIVIYMILEQG